MSNDAKLVRMANQIATFFHSQPGEDGPMGVATHINKFWEPRMRRQFFDKKGQPLKLWTVNKVGKIDGIWTIRDQTMENLQDKSKARLETPEIDYSVQLTDSMFTPAYLHR